MKDVLIEPVMGTCEGVLATTANARNTGVIVLGGSSGRVDIARAQLFAGAGVQALALKWFGGNGQPPGICEVALETFTRAIDHLTSRGCQRIILVGTSKGAEAALLVATTDVRVDAVVAISPSSVVWGNIGAGVDGVSWPERSSWTSAGTPLDFVPTVVDFPHDYRDGLRSYRSLFEHCLTLNPKAIVKARIPVELARAEILVVAGGDDALWPSDLFARQILQSREQAGMSATIVFEPGAGHRVLLPGEDTPRSKLHAHGGGDAPDSALGARAWKTILPLLQA